MLSPLSTNITIWKTLNRFLLTIAADLLQWKTFINFAELFYQLIRHLARSRYLWKKESKSENKSIKNYVAAFYLDSELKRADKMYDV
jgi:hypothetical protein